MSGGLTPRGAPTSLAEAMAAWVHEPAAGSPEAQAPRVMQVTVTRPTGAGPLPTRTTTYTGLYASSFAAYDDALSRFPDACRVEVQCTTRRRPSTVPVVYPSPRVEPAHAPR